MVTEKNYEEFGEFMKALNVTVNQSAAAAEDGKINGADILGFITKIPVISKGFIGIQEIVPVLMSADPEVKERRDQIIRENFDHPNDNAQAETYIENMVTGLILVYSNTNALIRSRKPAA